MKRVLFAEFYPAALGAVVAIAATIVLRTVLGTRLLAELVLDAMLGILPGESFSELLGVFGPYGKALFFASTLFGIFSAYVLIWYGLGRRLVRATDELAQHAAMAAFAVFGLFVTVSIVLVLATDASLRSTSWFDYSMVALVAALLYAGVAGFQTLTVSDAYGHLSVDMPPEDDGRRQFLRALPALGLGAAAVVLIARTLRNAAGGGVQSSRRGEPTLAVTPTEDFYVVSKNLIDPTVNGNNWRLHVTGLVGEELELTYEELRAFPEVEQYTTMQCISNRVGGELMGNALWRGVELGSVLERAGLQNGATHALFRAADGYTVSLPIGYAVQEKVVLAYEMNGEPLSDKHGFPTRLLSPGIYGMMHPKWITDIVVVDEEILGYWQQQGWSQEARMNTSVRIDQPANRETVEQGLTLVGGIAFSGDRGIGKVEVSTDGGETWAEARLKPPLGPYTWVLWEFDWTPPEASDERITIVARATDGAGELQTAVERPPYPDGATGYHRVQVSISDKPRAETTS